MTTINYFKIMVIDSYKVRLAKAISAVKDKEMRANNFVELYEIHRGTLSNYLNEKNLSVTKL